MEGKALMFLYVNKGFGSPSPFPPLPRPDMLARVFESLRECLATCLQAERCEFGFVPKARKMYAGGYGFIIGR
jgi:hypothetical protein